MTSNAIRSSTSLRRLIQPAALVALGLASTVALADAPICEPKAFVTTLATFAPYGQPVAAPREARTCPTLPQSPDGWRRGRLDSWPLPSGRY